MDRTGICADSGCHGSCLENRQTQVGPDRGTDSPMSLDPYSMIGLAAVMIAAGLIGLRMAKDEYLLRRKRVLAEKY